MNFRLHIALLTFVSLLQSFTQLAAQTLPAACPSGLVRYSTSGLDSSVFNWAITGGTIVFNYNDSIDVQWGTVPGNYSLTVQEVTLFGCTGPVANADVQVVKNTVSLGGDQTVCNGAAATFTPAGDTYTSILWQDGSTGNTFQTNMAGSVSVQATNTTGCVAFDTAMLFVNNPRPLNLGNDTTLCGDGTILLEGGSASSYEWTYTIDGQQFTSNAQELEIRASALSDQEVYLKIVDNNGCENEDSIKILRCTVGGLGKITNTITADNNGINDVWELGNISQYPSARIEIYDRWGRLVFLKNGGYANTKADGFSGKDMKGKDLPMDSYFYVINLRDGSKPYTGYILIIR